MHSPLTILRIYRRSNISTKTFLALRWALTPYEEMASRFPKEGIILDLGAGHGLLSRALALQSAMRRVVALDHDEKRIELARLANQGISNCEFSIGDFSALKGMSDVSGIAMIDVLHYFPFEVQEKIFSDAWNSLRAGGTLCFREIDTEAGLVSSCNKLHERVMKAVGFTKASELHFRSPDSWKKLAESKGFSVAVEKMTAPMFADLLFTCTKG